MIVLRRVAAAVLAATAVVLPSLAGAPAAQAALGDEVTSFDVDVTVRSDGSLHVRETIGYSFFGVERHGIYRYVPYRYDVEDQPKHQRVIRVDGVRASSPTGAPAQTKVTTEDGNVVIRVGDPDRTVSGEHTYVVDYDVRGAMNGAVNGFPLAELAWDATGHDWDATIRAVRVSVDGPADVQAVACYAGEPGSRLPCAQARRDGTRAVFTQGRLERGQGLTVVVGYPVDAVDVPAPVLEERWSLGRAFSRDPLPLSAALLVLVGGVGGVLWTVWSRGRDRHYVGQVPGLLPTGDDPAVEARKPLFGAPEPVVQPTLPKDARPAEVGTLVDERADVLDVTATIVDLAVRGYLRIDELPATGRVLKKKDWRLVRLKPADETFRRYERTLFDALFAGRDEVALSELRQTFADDLAKVRDQLYDEVVYNKWFRRRPDTTRTTWTVLGAVLAGAGVFATFWLASGTRYGLTGTALTITGVTLLVSGRFMPARTGRGSAALAQALGFRTYLRTAEAEQIRFEEREQVFSRYLPYAIVFGETERWARTFASLGAGAAFGTAATAGWSPAMHGLYWYTATGGFDPASFGDAISSFASTTAGAIVAAAPSSSSGSGFSGGGFSGGGFGGGGGGSW